MLTHDLAAHGSLYAVPQPLLGPTELHYLGVRNRANVAVLQRNRIATVYLGPDSVRAEHIASHVKTCHLLAPDFQRLHGMGWAFGAYCTYGSRATRSLRCC